MPPALPRARADGARAGHEPNKLGSLDNHKQEPWKAALPDFIEHIYLKRFGRERPEVVVPIEQQARKQQREEAGNKRHQRRRARHRQRYRRHSLIGLRHKQSTPTRSELISTLEARLGATYAAERSLPSIQCCRCSSKAQVRSIVRTVALRSRRGSDRHVRGPPDRRIFPRPTPASSKPGLAELAPTLPGDIATRSPLARSWKRSKPRSTNASPTPP
jgi:hypothetical protein